MMNIIKGELKMKIKKIDEDLVTFDDDSELFSHHDTDCCESHYLDFSVLKHYNISQKTGKTINIYEQEFDFSNGVNFKRVDGMGILLFDVEGNSYLINDKLKIIDFGSYTKFLAIEEVDDENN